MKLTKNVRLYSVPDVRIPRSEYPDIRPATYMLSQAILHREYIRLQIEIISLVFGNVHAIHVYRSI